MYIIEKLKEGTETGEIINFIAIDSNKSHSIGILRIGNQNIGFKWRGTNPELFEIPGFELLAIHADFSIIILSTITGDLKLKIGIEFEFVEFKLENYSLLIVTELMITIINLNSLSISKIVSIPDIIIDIDIVADTIFIKTLDGKYEKHLY